MNPDIKPCDDFYDFACGRFINEVDIPSKDSMVLPSITSTLNKVEDQLVALIQEPIKASDAKPIAMAKKYFKDCMNTDAREKVGSEILLELIKKIGGWPLLGKANPGNKISKWWELAEACVAAGVAGDWFLRLQVEEDLRQSHQRVIYVRFNTRNELIYIKYIIFVLFQITPGTFSSLSIEPSTMYISGIAEEFGATNDIELYNEIQLILNFIADINTVI